jgi:tRNA-specific 2-thiouridylase
VDEAKDQSYFLYTLKADQLPHIIFPIGSYKKREVRALARSFNLPVAEKPDSQGLCFIGKVDMAEFLVRELGIRKGEVLNEKGEVIGMHDGAHLYTLGARHGFTVQEKTDTRHAYYIVSKDIEKNTITVAPKDSLKEHAPHSLELAQVTWIGESHAGAVDVQYRYHGPVVKAEIHNNHLRFMDIPKEPVAPGQSIVFYEGEICLGGGVAI